jgi:hypothetical protein
MITSLTPYPWLIQDYKGGFVQVHLLSYCLPFDFHIYYFA